jgi:cephalosporin hydroxylase
MDQTRHRWLANPMDLAWRIRGHLFGIAASPLVVSRTRDISANPVIDQMIPLVTGRHFFGVIHAMQMPTEISRLLTAVQALRPKRILEIGTARGGTLFMTSRVVEPDATLISLDLPGGMWGGGYPRWKAGVYRRMVLPSQEVHLIRADSHDPTSLNQIRSILNGERLDYLFIDGDHTYQGVKMDFEMYGPLVRSGGLIAFHDIADHPAGAGGDVPRYWRELAATHKVDEFVENPQIGCGIGLIHV